MMKNLRKILRDFEQIPNLSFVDKAMVEAYKLQKDDRIEEAVQKWRSIATIVDEADKNLAARAVEFCRIPPFRRRTRRRRNFLLMIRQ